MVAASGEPDRSADGARRVHVVPRRADQRRCRLGVHPWTPGQRALARRPHPHAGRLSDRPRAAGARARPGPARVGRGGRTAVPGHARHGATRRLPGLPGQPAAGLGRQRGFGCPRGGGIRPLRRPAGRGGRGAVPALARLQQGAAGRARARGLDGSRDRGRRRGRRVARRWPASMRCRRSSTPD